MTFSGWTTGRGLLITLIACTLCGCGEVAREEPPEAPQGYQLPNGKYVGAGGQTNTPWMEQKLQTAAPLATPTPKSGTNTAGKNAPSNWFDKAVIEGSTRLDAPASKTPNQ